MILVFVLLLFLGLYFCGLLDWTHVTLVIGSEIKTTAYEKQYITTFISNGGRH
jgi:hypothetical protein